MHRKPYSYRRKKNSHKLYLELHAYETLESEKIKIRELKKNKSRKHLKPYSHRIEKKKTLKALSRMNHKN